jgi:hypothetical protein
MNGKTHPFVQLRKTIRHSAAQYRRSEDNSDSIFHPEQGFIYAYQIHAVEQALDEYELTLPTEFIPDKREDSLEEDVFKRGKALCEESESMEVRDFARTVMAYITLEKPTKPLRAQLVGFGDPVPDKDNNTENGS